MTAHKQNTHIINIAGQMMPVVQGVLRGRFKHLDVLVQIPEQPALKIARDFDLENIKYSTGFILNVYPKNFSSTYESYNNCIHKLIDCVYANRGLFGGFIRIKFDKDSDNPREPLQLLFTMPKFMPWEDAE